MGEAKRKRAKRGCEVVEVSEKESAKMFKTTKGPWLKWFDHSSVVKQWKDKLFGKKGE